MKFVAELVRGAPVAQVDALADSRSQAGPQEDSLALLGL